MHARSNASHRRQRLGSLAVQSERDFRAAPLNGTCAGTSRVRHRTTSSPSAAFRRRITSARRRRRAGGSSTDPVSSITTTCSQPVGRTTSRDRVAAVLGRLVDRWFVRHHDLCQADRLPRLGGDLRRHPAPRRPTTRSSVRPIRSATTSSPRARAWRAPPGAELPPDDLLAHRFGNLRRRHAAGRRAADTGLTGPNFYEITSPIAGHEPDQFRRRSALDRPGSPTADRRTSSRANPASLRVQQSDRLRPTPGPASPTREPPPPTSMSPARSPRRCHRRSSTRISSARPLPTATAAPPTTPSPIATRDRFRRRRRSPPAHGGQQRAALLRRHHLRHCRHRYAGGVLRRRGAPDPLTTRSTRSPASGNDTGLTNVPRELRPAVAALVPPDFVEVLCSGPTVISSGLGPPCDTCGNGVSAGRRTSTSPPARPRRSVPIRCRRRWPGPAPRNTPNSGHVRHHDVLESVRSRAT